MAFEVLETTDQVEVNGIEMEVGTLLFSGLDECIVGMSTHFNPSGHHEDLPVYDYDLMVQHFYTQFIDDCPDSKETEDGNCENDHYLEAVEWIDFNVIGMYAAEKGHCMPIVLMRKREEEYAPYAGTD
jgi:hypothetical protein